MGSDCLQEAKKVSPLRLLGIESRIALGPLESRGREGDVAPSEAKW